MKVLKCEECGDTDISTERYRCPCCISTLQDQVRESRALLREALDYVHKLKTQPDSFQANFRRRILEALE